MYVYIHHKMNYKLSIWLVVDLPSENEFVSWDDEIPIYGTIRNVRNHQPAISMVLAREISGWVYPEIFQGLKIFTAVWSIKLLLNLDTNPLTYEFPIRKCSNPAGCDSMKYCSIEN